MADLSNINLNKDVAETGSFSVVPEGTYKAVIAGDKLVATKDQKGRILELTVQIIDGPHTGSTVKDRLNISNASQQAQNIAQGTLKRICNVLKVAYPPQTTDALLGKPMLVTVGIEGFTSNKTGNPLKSNKIKNYAPIPQVAATAPTAVAGW